MKRFITGRFKRRMMIVVISVILSALFLGGCSDADYSEEEYAEDDYSDEEEYSDDESYSEEADNSEDEDNSSDEKNSYFRDKTLKTLLEDPLIEEIAPNAISKWDLSKEDFYNWTLQEIADDMGWTCLESGFTKLFENAKTGRYYFNLYTEEECVICPEKDKTNIVFFPSDEPGAGEKPFILLIPGGGFVNVWNMTEGWPIAKEFNDLGYNVFILTYQVGIKGAAVKNMDDINRAFDIITTHKEEFNVNPDSYITCGFSAGGFIACLWNTDMGYRAFGRQKPQCCFPIYPVTAYRINEEDGWKVEDNEYEFISSASGENIQESDSRYYEIPCHVEGFPRTAIFLAAEDNLVNPKHSKELAKALDRAGIPCRLEIGPSGGHGFGDGKGMCMEGWPERAIEWYESENKQSD